MRGNQVYTECVRGGEGGREAGEKTEHRAGNFDIQAEGFNMVLYTCNFIAKIKQS